MENLQEQVTEQQQFESLINDLIENNYAVCDNFLNPETILGLRKNLIELNRKKQMLLARIGNGNHLQKVVNTRNDHIKWLSEDTKDPFEVLYTEKMKRFIQYLNETCYTTIQDFEAHYAIYKVNSFYKKHIDQFKDNQSRQFSMILYLNRHWLEIDGGNLSLYFDDRTDNILPLGGRMVFFRSNQILHEVHPSLTRDRMSLTAWLKARP